MDLDASLWCWEYIRICFIFTENYTIQIFDQNYCKKLEKYESGEYIWIYFICKWPWTQDCSRWWRNIRIYFICTAKFLTFWDGGGILGSILFVLQNFLHFMKVEEYIRIYFICTAKFLTFWTVEEYLRIYSICTANYTTQVLHHN